MYFWFNNNGDVEPFTIDPYLYNVPAHLVDDWIESERQEWKRWHAKHEVIAHSEVGMCMVKTTFSGTGEPGGMFYVTVYDARGKEMEEIQCLTMEKALRSHKRCVQELRRAHGTSCGDYEPSSP